MRLKPKKSKEKGQEWLDRLGKMNTVTIFLFVCVCVTCSLLVHQYSLGFL